MKPLSLISTLIFLAVIPFSCKQNKNEKIQTDSSITQETNKKDSLQRMLSLNIYFIGDTLLKGKSSLIKSYIVKYEKDTCGIVTYKTAELKSGFEGDKSIGDINRNGINDTVFVIPPFNYCDDGDSYAFYDSTLPRLYTDSYCCHPENLFPIGDINEDGIDEICIFYSSCTSRFKSLIAYTLKDKMWKQIGRSLFDIGIMKPDKEKRVRKVGKGKFEMLSIEGFMQNGKYVDEKTWERFSF